MFSSQRQAGNCWNWPREIDASRILRFAVMCCRLPFLVYHSLCGFGSISVFAFLAGKRLTRRVLHRPG